MIIYDARFRHAEWLACVRQVDADMPRRQLRVCVAYCAGPVRGVLERQTASALVHTLGCEEHVEPGRVPADRLGPPDLNALKPSVRVRQSVGQRRGGAEASDERVLVTPTPRHVRGQRLGELPRSRAQLVEAAPLVGRDGCTSRSVVEALDDLPPALLVEAAARTSEEVKPLRQLKFHRRRRQAEPTPSLGLPQQHVDETREHRARDRAERGILDVHLAPALVRFVDDEQVELAKPEA